MNNFILESQGMNCWKCNSYIDIEEVFFTNLCPYCGESQSYDKEDYDNVDDVNLEVFVW